MLINDYTEERAGLLMYYFLIYVTVIISIKDTDVNWIYFPE